MKELGRCYSQFRGLSKGQKCIKIRSVECAEANLASSTVKARSQRKPHQTGFTYTSIDKNYFAFLMQLTQSENSSKARKGAEPAPIKSEIDNLEERTLNNT